MLGATLCLLLSLSGCDTVARFRGAKTAFSGDSAYAYAGQVVAFGPRYPGSPGHKAAGDWIVTQMRARADTVEVQEWTHTTQDGRKLPMRNVMARFRPQATQRILYITHWDTRPTADNDRNLGAQKRPIVGANDGASGVGLFMALGDVFKRTPPAVGVDLLFVDGEDWGDFGASADDTTNNKDVLIGSRYFANTMTATYKPIFGVVWDMIGDKALNIKQEGHSLSGAPEVVSRVWATAKELGYGKQFLDESTSPITDDHYPFIRKGLRVIDVVDIDYCSDGAGYCFGSPTNLHHTHGDTMEHVSAKSLQVIGDVALTLVIRFN